MTLRYDDFNIDEEALRGIRHDLYHSRGPGFHVLRGFLGPLLWQHMRDVWTRVDPFYKHEKFTGWSGYNVDSPNVENRYPDGNYFFNNFLHNDPLDAATHSVSGFISVLRNRVEGKDPLHRIVPHRLGAVAYRVVVTRNVHVAAPPHRDWIEAETFDLAALQATLMLSTPGVDYEGEGFSLVRNDGRRVVFGRDVEIAAGDLVLWRFNNQHAIMNVRSREDQAGLVRIIYSTFERSEAEAATAAAQAPAADTAQPAATGPAASVTREAPAAAQACAPAADPQPVPRPQPAEVVEAPPPVFAGRLRERVKRTWIGDRVIVPLYRKLRYRS